MTRSTPVRDTLLEPIPHGAASRRPTYRRGCRPCSSLCNRHARRRRSRTWRQVARRTQQTASPLPSAMVKIQVNLAARRGCSKKVIWRSSVVAGNSRRGLRALPTRPNSTRSAKSEADDPIPHAHPACDLQVLAPVRATRVYRVRVVLLNYRYRNQYCSLHYIPIRSMLRREGTSIDTTENGPERDPAVVPIIVSRKGGKAATIAVVTQACPTNSRTWCRLRK